MSLNKHKLLMISGIGASVLVQGKRGGFYYTLEEFSKYWKRIDIICPRISNNPAAAGDQPFQSFDNVFIHPSPWGSWKQPWFILKKGIEIYKKEKFDLFTIHSYPPFYNDIGGRWLYNRVKVPYILEIMHIAGYPKAGSFKERFYKILIRLFIRFFAKKAKAVRVINQKQASEFLKKAGVNQEKLKYIPAFYIDLDVFKPVDTKKKYDIVFSGRLVKSKGINLLLEATEKLKLQNPNFKLIIIGEGPLKSKIEKFIRNNKLENNVEFAGWLPTVNDLARIYNQSKIFVMASFNEGGPRTPLEAMACKVPVITSRVGIMLDIVKDNENALFVDWDAENIREKIIALLNNENLYKKIAENGYKTVQQFEKKEAIKNYAETYQNLLHYS